MKTIESHYHQEGLFEDILQRLKEVEPDTANLTREHVAGVDEFHVRGAAVSKELAESINLKNARVLDVGCGLGGPCRMLAEEHHCITTGVDISREFIRTASGLSNLLGMEKQTTFMQADALELPFEDNTFDAVWTQHVQMNISDKKKFYSEIRRVLKTGGFFLYYDIFKSENGSVTFPVPWAETIEQSFLVTPDDMGEVLDSLDMKVIEKKDQTIAGIDFFDMVLKKMKEQGPPKIGLNVLMGESTKPKLMNLYNHLQHGDLVLQSGVYQKV
ncbi:MAG: methyltransferase domain-containing protein [Saprospiraceae bacterium]|nr:methyltransferase domain-containing protein [Saprospiraceae bacterium]